MLEKTEKNDPQIYGELRAEYLNNFGLDLFYQFAQLKKIWKTKKKEDQNFEKIVKKEN